MSDYIVCVRNTKNGELGNEPGPTKFLKVASQPTDYGLEDKVSRGDWVREVLDVAVVGTNESTNKPFGDILVFIHGYNNSTEDVLTRHRKIKESLGDEGYQGAVISFDWPSDELAINYIEDRMDAKQTAFRLVSDCIELFSRLQTTDCEINVHLLAHSTGACVVREAFDDADDRSKIAESNWNVSQIMFIGADVSSKSMELGNAKSSSLYRHCIRLTNYSNAYDSVLKLSNVKRIGVAPRVGRVGMPEEIPENAVNVECGEYFEANEPNIEAIGNKTHSWHIGDSRFTRDMYLTISGDTDRHYIETRIEKDGKLLLAS